MYKLTCKDLGTPECPYESKAETKEAAVEDMMRHAAETHADKIKDKSEGELRVMMESAVTEE
jgi:predicted small metal-binding protein